MRGVDMIISYFFLTIGIIGTLIVFYVTTEVFIFSKNKPIRLKKYVPLIAFVVGIFIISTSSLYYYYHHYHVPKYSAEELGDISVDDWKGLSRTEKLRVGQSFYIHWKDSSMGLYRAENYVSLIEEYINCSSDCIKNENYQYVYHIIFYYLSGT
jgi:hypothetical protein